MGAAIARSRHHPKELTSAARKRFMAKFETEVRAEHPNLEAAEVQRRAGELRRAYFLKLAVQSSIARSKKRAATSTKVTTQEADRHVRDRTTAAAS